MTDPISSDEEVQAVGDSRGALSAQVKKRKGGGDRGVMGREGAGTSTKRPRHSLSSVKLSETNKRSAKSGLPGLGASGSSDMDIGSGASAAKLSAAPPSTKSAQSAGPGLLGASSIRSKPPQEGVFKSVRSPPQPGPSVASSSTGRRGSTASNLAALWPSSAPRAAGPSIQKWGEHHDDRTHPKERYMQLKEEVHKGKGKGKEKEKTSVTPEYLGDLSDESVSSSIGPIRNTGVGSLSRSVAGPSQNVASAFTSTSRRTLVGKTLARSADTREERGPLYVNERRQVARKTIGSSKPSKRFHFDRRWWNLL
ncbi:hypothetical protein P691DRAFT_113925 [Macrolepiota fuliginosa MF-IS2]|uniref:Uncharacterized protein n=1 Tax=Macrolepiota fuliginosa MF-IS2 TaxID=1400762 RepID=A0A9P5XB64_9AGAR|nr:hypothetical protein P691DRAFT_113925 [Macrolepiota fuliginosa MF-IS2]